MNLPTTLPVTFQWPELLWLLAALPLIIAGYAWLLRRRKKSALRYASLALGGSNTNTAAQKIRRVIPPLLFLLALIAMIGAISRPAAVVTLPVQNQTIILAMDVSGSMRATDVEPNRLAAAQAAAKAFVNEQPKTTKIGIVSFAGTAAVAQAPTTNREDVIAAIDRFQLQRGTAIGSSIVLSLATLFPNTGIDLGELQFGGRDAALKGTPFAQRFAEKKQEFKAVPPGSYETAAVVLLSDGQNTAGPDPMKAAQMAAERGVKIYTVGIGTPGGTTLQFEGWSFRVRLDEDSLKQIANATRGEYLFAGNAADLKKIYQSLNTKFAFEKRETEITALFAAAAALLATLSGLLSLLWFNRIF